MHPFITVHQPYEIAPETFVVPTVGQPPGAPVAVNLNTMVIRGAEPVIVDTGAAVVRDEWLAAVGSLVDFADVRHVFVSHDDNDHWGNALRVLELAPKAQLISTWFLSERRGDTDVVPVDRQRWVNDGESFFAGDRELRAIRPPIFDGPTTRGLYDTKTGVYWAVDAFGSPVPAYTQYADELDRAFWTQGDFDFNRFVSPWHTMLDAGRFGEAIDRVQSLQPSVIASCHGPVVRGEMVDEAFRLARELPHMDAVANPTQADLDGMLAQIAQAA